MCKSYSVVDLRSFLAFVSLLDCTRVFLCIIVFLFYCNIRAFRAAVWRGINVLVQLFPALLRLFLLLTLHPASRKGFVVGFNIPVTNLNRQGRR